MLRRLWLLIPGGSQLFGRSVDNTFRPCVHTRLSTLPRSEVATHEFHIFLIRQCLFRV